MTCNRILMLVLSIAALFIISAEVVAADVVNVSLEGHFGGAVYAVAVPGDYAYIGLGQDFAVLDITNPAAPLELSKLRTADFVKDITLSGNYAYVANGSAGLEIVYVSNKTAPALAGSYDTAGSAYGAAVAGLCLRCRLD